MMVATVLSAMPWASLVKLVAIENTETSVLKHQTHHHTTMVVRSQVSRPSTRGQLDDEHRRPEQVDQRHQAAQPAVSHAERGSVLVVVREGAARRAISQFVRTTTLAITANSASTLAATPSPGRDPGDPRVQQRRSG